MFTRLSWRPRITLANQPHTCTLRDPYAAVSTATSLREKLVTWRKLSSLGTNATSRHVPFYKNNLFIHDSRYRVGKLTDRSSLWWKHYTWLELLRKLRSRAITAHGGWLASCVSGPPAGAGGRGPRLRASLAPRHLQYWPTTPPFHIEHP